MNKIGYLFLYVGWLYVIWPNMTFAQSPQGLNYQAVARTDSGSPLSNRSIRVRTGIYDIAASSLDFEEEHIVDTDDFGLFAIIIGNGTSIDGDFAQLQWDTKSYGLSVKIDIGEGFKDLGISLLQSTPYAFYADKAGSIGDTFLDDLTDVTVASPQIDQIIKWNGQNWVLATDNVSSGGGGDIAEIVAGTGLSGGGNAGIVTINAQNASALWNANQFQGRDVANNNPNRGDVLKWNGSSWSPQEDSEGASAITEVVAGTGLSGGGNTGVVTLNSQNTSAIWNANQLRGRNVTNTNPNRGDALKWNGSSWSPQPDEQGSSFWTRSPVTDADGNTNTYLLTTDRVSVGFSQPLGFTTLEVNGQASKPGGGSWAVLSDARAKNDVVDFNPGLSEILKVNPVWYNYNNSTTYDTAVRHVGVIAQELATIAPYMVGKTKSKGVERMIVDPSAFQFMLINAVKEQQKIIDELLLRVEQLENR